MTITLLGTAASCTIVIIAQSAATSRSYALRYSETFSENRDMVGLAAANVAAACSGTFVVNGSPTKTEMVDMAGGRSQIAQLTTAVIVLLVLLFLTRPLSYMPVAVLSTVVFLIGVKLIDIKGMRDLYAKRRDEFLIAVLTALAVAFVGVKQGILLAIGISLVDHIRRSYRPTTNLVVPAAGGAMEYFEPSSERMAVPGAMLYHFAAPLYYANAEFFMAEVLSTVHGASSQVRWFVVRLDTITDVDYSASKMLLELVGRLRALHVDLVFSDVNADMRKQLECYGILKAVGENRAFASLREALDTYTQLGSGT